MKYPVRLSISFFMVFSIFTMAFMICNAQSADKSFTYNLDNEAVAAPSPTEFYRNITGHSLGTVNLSEPSDICNDKNGNLYIADKGNNRIVITDRYGRFLKVIDEFMWDGKKSFFNQPEGITVTSDGGIYICDTRNARIIQFSDKYEPIRVIDAPSSNALGNNFVFTPIRIAVDELGRMYVVSRNFNLGIIELNKSGQFNKIYGSIDVKYSITDIIWRMISTKEQKKRSIALIPNEYSSVCADEKNFIYCCSAFYDSSSLSTGSVKKLNALGKNVLKGVPDESINLYAQGTYQGPETYVDICAMGNEVYAVLDNTRGRIFVYNNDGDMLFEFGGKGQFESTFGKVSALTYSSGYFYIADSKNNCVSIFALTNYANKYLLAAEYHSNGNYSEENEVWKDIYRLNNNSICAIRNFGRVNYREGNYGEAMKYFKLANDRTSYSLAYDKYRKEWINNNFTAVFIGTVVIIAAFIALLVYKSKHRFQYKDKRSFKATLNYSLKVIFRPISGFWDLKHEGYGSMPAATVIFVATIAFYSLYNSLKGFIFSDGTHSASIFTGILTIVVPFFLFVISNWCVTSLMGGEGSLKYIFMGTAYSLTPMVITLPFSLVFSLILTEDESGILKFAVGIMILWTLFLIVCSNMEIHSFTIGKTILVLALTVIIMIIVVFLLMLIFAVFQQISGVITDMYYELYMRF